jgi:hypothetical protein
LPPKIAVRYQARECAIEAVKGKLFNISYNFEVLDDPDGNGFLVYALGTGSKRHEFVLAGHFRITVSADGRKAERVDPLSESLLMGSTKQELSARDYRKVGDYFNQVVSNKPVETLIYTGRLTGKHVWVGTPDGKLWLIDNGKMSTSTAKAGNKSEAAAARASLEEGRKRTDR